MLFAGQYFDEESGLAYNRFRYYDPNTACYLNSDPMGLEGGSTPYFYVQNPLDWVDFFGLSSCELVKAMEKAGASRPINSAAHHIVPEKAKGAQQARDILSKHNIDINSAVNGVFLPNKNNQGTLSGILHNGRHPNKYISDINRRISEADQIGGKKRVISELNKIRTILSKAELNSDWKGILK